jgi:hypothetical protein
MPDSAPIHAVPDLSANTNRWGIALAGVMSAVLPLIARPPRGQTERATTRRAA